MQSPLKTWEPEIRAAVFRSAPKKAAHLANLLHDHNITLDFVEDNGLVLRAYHDGHKIEVGWPALEALWCAAYAYIALYQARVSSQRSDRHEFYIGSRDLSFGKDLLGWSLNRLRCISTADWPAGLPIPTRPLGGEFDGPVLELFLVAIAWFLHHEIGHQLLQRPCPTDRENLDLELEADRYATEWVLDEVVDEDVATKIALGICIATGFLEAHRDNRESDSHPKPFDRLNTALRSRPFADDSLAYAFALSVLQMNWFMREYRTFIQVEDRSFRELFHQFGRCLSEQPTDTWLSVRPEDAACADAAVAMPLQSDDTCILAYALWEERQRPWGTPDHDWFAAERLEHQLRLGEVVKWLRDRAHTHV